MHGVRPALFHPKALEAIRSFPKSARREMGESILELQKGSHLTMPRSRPMPAVGPGVQEIRVRDADRDLSRVLPSKIRARSNGVSCLRKALSKDPAQRD
jgi:phage-related protein